jgi:hypothetical protein
VPTPAEVPATTPLDTSAQGAPDASNPPAWTGDAQMTPEAARRLIRTVRPRSVPDSPAPQLLSQDVLQRFTPALRAQIQQALQEIYSDDPAYVEAYQRHSMPLSDNVVGPITVSWLSRFWFDFKIEPVGNLTNESIGSLLHFAAIVNAHPEWKADLLSAGLARWIDSADAEDRARYYQIRLAGTDEQIAALLWLYHYETDRSRETAPDPDSELLTHYTYRLTAADFKLLASKSQVIAKLSALQDVTYLNQSMFDAAVLDALKDLGQQAKAYLPAARKAALEQSYELTPGSLQRLRDGKNVPDSLIDALETLSDTSPNLAAFKEAIVGASEKVDVPIDPYMTEIVDAAETSTSYTLSASALAQLSANQDTDPVPPVILQMLKGLQNLEYPQQWLFDDAVMTRLRDGVGACQSGIPGSVADARKVSAEQMSELAAELKEPALSEQLDKLRSESSCGAVEPVAMPQPIKDLYGKYQASIRQTARKMPAYDPDKHVLWDGNGCGCVLDHLDGGVYGFYPFWLAGTPQKVNFSTLSRIEYYGATFDDTGVLRQANDGRELVAAVQNGEPAQRDFVEVARRHQTAVDWVIQRNDWRSWHKMDKGAKEQVLARLASDIVKLMSIRQRDLTSTVSNFLPFGERFAQTNGDGVTLFFDGYPDDDVSVGIFNAFVDTLRTSLRAARVGDNINVMMRHTAVGTGIYDYTNLYGLIAASDANRTTDFLSVVERDRNMRPRFLVLIEEPTTDSKKQLRSQIESGLHGEKRMTVLRQLVPIITFDHENWTQLQDDIIYSKDNFGGIGFWPMPMTQLATGDHTVKPDDGLPMTADVQQCDVSTSVSRCLVDFYQTPPGAESSVICTTVCENLFAFHLATNLAIVLAIGCAALYFVSCRWREMMTRYYHAPALAIGALCIVLVLSLLFCDPFLRWLERGYVIPIVLVLVMLVVIASYQYRLRARDEQP